MDTLPHIRGNISTDYTLSVICTITERCNIIYVPTNS